MTPPSSRYAAPIRLRSSSGVDGDRDVRALLTVGGCVTEVQVPVQHFFQGVPAADRGAAPVRGAVLGRVGVC